MGMFDRIYADREDQSVEGEWQTKAFGCNLDRFNVGDTMPPRPDGLEDYQFAVMGGREEGFSDSLATVRAGVLVAVGVPRIPLVDYWGDVVENEGDKG